MNVGSKLIFIVGPGGSGKSTAGRFLAERLGYGFADLDAVFYERVGIIGDYIGEFGYKRYSEENSRLFHTLLAEYRSRYVFPLSSGFQVHEDSPELVRKHRRLLKRSGVSILLLPSRSLEAAMEIIVPRQMARGIPGFMESRERAKLASRFPRYKRVGDIRIFSSADPSSVADLMVAELRQLGLPG